MKIELKILGNLKTNPIFADGGELQEYRDNGPKYAHEGDAGLDLRACITAPLAVFPGESLMVNTGLASWIGSLNEVKEDHITVAGIIVPRSGLGSRKGIVLGNLTGVCDENYQGEIMISVWNRSEHKYTINPADKICQMMFMPVFRPEFTIVSEFSDSTVRGVGGFGSTGQ